MFNTKDKKGFDIVSNINRIFPENIEFHLPGHQFTGPNTNLNKRLINYTKNAKHDGIHEWSKPINRLDKAAYLHDVSYSKFKDLENRHKADKILINVATEILNDDNSSRREKIEAGIVKFIMDGKLKIGIGLGGTYGGNLDVNELVRQAQQTAQSNQFQGKTDIAGIIAPLLFLTGAVGIPTIIKLVHDKLKKDNK